MENQSLNQMLNEQTRLNSENSIPTNTNIPMSIPLQMIIQNYQTMFNILHSPNNLTGVLQSNIINRVGTLYKLFLDFLLPIISGLIDFTKDFISKSEEQDKKIDIQARNLRAIGNLLDAVKDDLKNTKINFDSSMKKYHENLDRVANEYRKSIDDLANKLIIQEDQDIKPIKPQTHLMMYAGNKTKKHKKHRRKVSK
jgi:hypothetical protein